VGSITRARFDEDDRPRPMIAPAAAINVIWMLSDFSESNGGTRIVPRSHLSGRQPDKARDKDVESIAATGPAGTAVLIDGRLWHGTGANIGNTPRWAALVTYCGPQYRPQENFTVGIDPAVLEGASDRLRTLLGLKVWYGYGRVENPTVEFISPGERSLPELSPDKTV
jgi:ectoine hydroxylase-related dioxygenase (phytanoyl-CoA dioxygenase family)